MSDKLPEAEIERVSWFYSRALLCVERARHQPEFREFWMHRARCWRDLARDTRARKEAKEHRFP